MKLNNTLVVLTACLAVVLISSGCATKKYVNTEMEGVEAASGARMDEIETQVEQNQSTLQEHDESIGEISRTAQEALERALAAGKLAEGKFLYEAVFSDDTVHFGFDEDNLSDPATQALDIFVADLKARDESVFVEIQGHTDSVGTDTYNLELGQRRAESVRRHLSQSGIPLHRMAVISYGESAPVSDETSTDGRAQNRRVTLVVLK